MRGVGYREYRHLVRAWPFNSLWTEVGSPPRSARRYLPKERTTYHTAVSPRTRRVCPMFTVHRIAN